MTPEIDLAGLLLASLAWTGVLSLAGWAARWGMDGMVKTEQEQERKEQD